MRLNSKHHSKKQSARDYQKSRNKSKARRKWLQGKDRVWIKTSTGTVILRRHHPNNVRPDWW
jgi:hypothetical protein